MNRFVLLSLTLVALASSTALPSCIRHKCALGERCFMQQVQCFVPPCYPVPSCEKDPNYLPGDEIVPTCEGHQCPAGQRCVLQQVQCIRAPCHPIPNCV